MTTTGMLAEMLIERYAGHNTTADVNLHPEMAKRYVIQALNELLKLQYISEQGSGFGDMIPPDALIATYEDLPVEPLSALDDEVAGDDQQAKAIDNDNLNLRVWFNTQKGPYVTDDYEMWITDPRDQDDNATILVDPRSDDVWEITLLDFEMETATAQELEEYMTNVPVGGYLQFDVPLAGPYPSRFTPAGMTNLTVIQNTKGKFFVNFLYDPGATRKLPAMTRVEVESSDQVLPFIQKSQSARWTLVGFSRHFITNKSIYQPAMVRLPVAPIQVPRGMGVWQVYDPDRPFDPYLPLQSGRFAVGGMLGRNGRSDRLGSLVAYTYHDKRRIIFNRQVRDMPEKVTMQMLVFDPSSLGDFDPIMIPADMEGTVLDRAMEMVLNVLPQDIIADDSDERLGQTRAQ